MVVPPSCPGLNIEILVDGQPLQEYDDIDEGPIPPNTVTKYIEARSGANFAVRARFDGDFPFPAGSVGITTMLDKQYKEKHLMHQSNFFNPSGAVIEGCTRRVGHNTNALYKYRFIALDTVEADIASMKDLSTKDLKAVGIITVTLQYFRSAFKIQPRVEHVANKTLGSISEEVFKGQPRSHQGGVDQTASILTYQEWFAATYLGKGPFVTVNFKYRSLDLLRALHIIPREPTLLPLEERREEELTPDELRQVVRLLKDRDAVALKIKKEANNKRTRSGSAETVGDDDVVIVDGPSHKRRRGGNKEVIVLD